MIDVMTRIIHVTLFQRLELSAIAFIYTNCSISQVIAAPSTHHFPILCNLPFNTTLGRLLAAPALRRAWIVKLRSRKRLGTHHNSFALWTISLHPLHVYDINSHIYIDKNTTNDFTGCSIPREHLSSIKNFASLEN